MSRLWLVVAPALLTAPLLRAQLPTGPGSPAPGVPPRPSGIEAQAGPRVPPGLDAEGAAAFRAALADYERCTREQASGMRLAEATEGVISLRERRVFWEAELGSNHTLGARYPGGYSQMVEETFAAYVAAGGTAASVAEVQPDTAPCTSPWTTYQRPAVPITDVRRLPVTPR